MPLQCINYALGIRFVEVTGPTNFQASAGDLYPLIYELKHPHKPGIPVFELSLSIFFNASSFMGLDR